MTPSHSSRPFRNLSNNKYKDGGFKLWKTKGISIISKGIKYLDMDGILLTFQELCDKHQIPSKHFFLNIQLKSFMSSRSIDIMYIHKLSLIEEIIGKRSEKDQLSKYYNLIMFNSKESAVDKLNA